MIKQRNIALCIVFSIITFGIYALYWFVCLTNDANQESGQTDATSGGVALLLTIVTCNIYGWFWAYKMGEKIQNRDFLLSELFCRQALNFDERAEINFHTVLLGDVVVRRFL